MQGWHNAFANSVGDAHANMWPFTVCLKLENSMIHLKIAQDNANGAPPLGKMTLHGSRQQITSNSK